MKRIKEILAKIADAIKKFKKKKVGAIIWQLGTSLLMLLVAGGIGVFLAVGKVKGGPEVFANEYFEYYANRNWYNMYKATEIEESKFINRETFADYMTQNEINGAVKDFEIEDIDRDGDYSEVKIVYTMEMLADTTEADTTVEADTKAEDETKEPETLEVEGTYTMKLKRQPENILLFYTTWKGWMEDNIIEGCTIEVPKYLTPTFDGMDISDCYTGYNQQNENAVYRLDRIFNGKHKIEVSGENIDTIEVEVEWNEDKASYILDEKDIKLKAEYEDGISTQAIDIVVAYYTAAFSGKNTDEIKSLIYEDETSYAHVDTQFDTMLSEVNREDGRTLINMEISSYECVVEEYKYMESVSVLVNYTASYNAKGERTVISGVRKNYVGTNTASARVYFKYINNAWTITDADVTCIDYSVETVEEEN